MKHLAPACFRAFVCAGSACPDSCCRAGWEIVPDEETLTLYQNLSGAAGARIRAGIVPGAAFPLRGRWHRASPASPMTDEVAAEGSSYVSVIYSAAQTSNTEPLLRQDEARVCTLLDPDGLCCVQKAFGHEALCRVCREYPRFHREFGGLTEHGLSLSCPTAWTLAVSAPPTWEAWEDEAPPVPNELDAEAYLRLRRGRDLALELLLREELPLPRRLALVRRLAAALQAAPERIVRHEYSIRLRRWSFLREGLRSVGPSVAALARRFLALEILSPAWKDALERFAALAEAGQLPAELRQPEQSEAYARWLWYELYKYWMDALDDGELLGRVDRSLDMLRLGMAMDRALPGEGPFLRRLSREIEHCEENLAALLDAEILKKP